VAPSATVLLTIDGASTAEAIVASGWAVMVTAATVLATVTAARGGGWAGLVVALPCCALAAAASLACAYFLPLRTAEAALVTGLLAPAAATLMAWRLRKRFEARARLRRKA
jgi:hypothetical protein